MQNKVTLLDNDIIFVEKLGDQNEQALVDLFEKVSELAAGLRAQNKNVLVLSDATREGKMDMDGRKMAAKIGQNLDYDKSATYGSSQYLYNVRKLLISATQLQEKVASFETRDQALAWLLKF